MAKDKFATYPETPGSPATTLVEVVPDDGTDLPQIMAGLNVATPGDVRVTTRDGSVGTVFVQAGTVFPLRIKRVWATGTTATGIRGLV
jgi:hypothetical protein